jgi:hypothetical protein
VETTPGADLLREMICFAAQRLMELEIESLTGAGYGGGRVASFTVGGKPRLLPRKASLRG